MRRVLTISTAVAAFVLWAVPIPAYKIEFSHHGLVNPSTMNTCTGLDDTSPFDAEFRRTGRGKGTTDIWLTDMNGSYAGCYVYNWTMEENDANGDGVIDPNTEATWTYNGGFKTPIREIRALNIINRDEFVVLHENGTVATYSRDPDVLGIDPDTPESQVMPDTSQSNFSIGVPHHSGWDPENQLMWINQGVAGEVRAYDFDRDSETFGQRVKTIRTPINYIEGAAFRKDNCTRQRFLYLYNGPGGPHQGKIWIYNLDQTSSEGDGTFIERNPYESGDLPPFHSECLSWDGAHFWMCGYSDGKVYRMNETLDSDCDGTFDGSDNCPDTPNEDQSDRDLDGVGDACDCAPDDNTEPGEDGSCPLPCVGGVSSVVGPSEHFAPSALLAALLPFTLILGLGALHRRKEN